LEASFSKYFEGNYLENISHKRRLLECLMWNSFCLASKKPKFKPQGKEKKRKKKETDTFRHTMRPKFVIPPEGLWVKG
jgi:hypothetical protein